MAVPAIKALRSFCPESEIILTGKKFLSDLFLGQKEINSIIPLADEFNLKSFLRGAEKLRAAGFDQGLLFTNSFSSALLFRAAGINNLTGYARDGRSLMLSRRTIPPRNTGHHSNYYLRLVEFFCTKKATTEFPHELSLSPAEIETGRVILKQESIGEISTLVSVAPAAAYGPAKAWPADRFQQVAQALIKENSELHVLLLGSERERELCRAISSGLGSRVHNLAGSLSLRETMIMIKLSRLLLGNDSGLMHLAAALGTTACAVFGPTVPGATAPLGEGHVILQHPVDCAPCRHRTCPLDHACMTSVTTTEVLSALQEILLR